MKLTIEGTPKEIADLVSEVQSRQDAYRAEPIDEDNSESCENPYR